jgi:hypothetical protein
MQLNVANACLVFRIDEEMEQYVSEGTLSSWAGFHSENSREGLEGENVLFVLESESYETHPNLAPRENYERALEWLLANEADVKTSALQGIRNFIDVMLNEYGIKDEELSSVSSVSQLSSMVDLSFVRVYPHSNDGKPYFGFEFECNWDPEHGCGVLLHGPTALAAGGSEAASGDAIPDHGGLV